MTIGITDHSDRFQAINRLLDALSAESMCLQKEKAEIIAEWNKTKMKNIEGSITFNTSHNHTVRLQRCTSGKFEGCGIHLPNDFSWGIYGNESGSLALITTGYIRPSLILKK